MIGDLKKLPEEPWGHGSSRAWTRDPREECQLGRSSKQQQKPEGDRAPGASGAEMTRLGFSAALRPPVRTAPDQGVTRVNPAPRGHPVTPIWGPGVQKGPQGPVKVTRCQRQEGMADASPAVRPGGVWDGSPGAEACLASV